MTTTDKTILEMVKETKAAKRAMWKAQDKYKMLKERLLKGILEEDLINKAPAWYTKIVEEL